MTGERTKTQTPWDSDRMTKASVWITSILAIYLFEQSMVLNPEWWANIILALIAITVASGLVALVFRGSHFAWFMDLLTGRGGRDHSCRVEELAEAPIIQPEVVKMDGKQAATHKIPGARTVSVISLIVVMSIALLLLWTSDTGSFVWWLSLPLASIALMVLLVNEWFPKPLRKLSTPPLDTTAALNKIYDEIQTQYAGNKERFGFAIALAVVLGSVGLIAAGLAEVLAPSDAGTLFIIIGFLEIMSLWTIWTVNDWRSTR